MVRMLFILIFLTSLANAQSLENGKSIYNGNCTVCHSIGKGKLIGPDLSGVTERRDKDWLHGFIRNSQQLIASGDEVANALFAEYKMAMPSYDFTSEEIEDILAYINSESETGKAEIVIDSAIQQQSEQLSADEEYPFWFLVVVSLILVIIITLLMVIFFLLKMTKRIVVPQVK